MNVIQTPIKDLWVMESKIHEDDRGTFTRVFCSKELSKINLNSPVKQINVSKTYAAGSIRGMHFQYPPYSEDKLVRCLKGKVFDVAIDLRKDSITFLHWHGEILSSENWNMIVIPKGFAHGFQVLEENSELLYLHTEAYSPNHEKIINYSDPRINISWPLPIGEVSTRDKNAEFLLDTFEGV